LTGGVIAAVFWEITVLGVCTGLGEFVPVLPVVYQMTKKPIINIVRSLSVIIHQPVSLSTTGAAARNLFGAALARAN
jgi:hypothetical protein